MRIRTGVLLLIVALGVGACDSPMDGDRTARLRLQLTDAPADYLASAVVEIGRIEINPVGGPAVVIVENAGSYDLLQLQHGVTAELGAAYIEAGRYLHMRLYVESAVLTLEDGYTFTDGTTTRSLAVPSGSARGIQINLDAADGDSKRAGIEIRSGETVLVVDFDVSLNFVMQGSAETSAGIQGYNFTPLLRAVVRNVAGSIAGTVSAPGDVTLEGLQVTATLQGSVDPPATTTVAADGSFLLPFLAPGTYDVTVVAPAGYTATSVEVTVGEKEDVAGVALEVVAE